MLGADAPGAEWHQDFGDTTPGRPTPSAHRTPRARHGSPADSPTADLLRRGWPLRLAALEQGTPHPSEPSASICPIQPPGPNTPLGQS